MSDAPCHFKNMQDGSKGTGRGGDGPNLWSARRRLKFVFERLRPPTLIPQKLPKTGLLIRH
jgi:hypothetical protein